MSGTPSSDHVGVDNESGEFSDNAIREAFALIRREVPDRGQAIELLALSSRRPVEQIKEILERVSAPATGFAKPVAKPEATPTPDQTQKPRQDETATAIRKPSARAPLQVKPSPVAMMALKHFALRSEESNVTILCAVHIKSCPEGGTGEEFTAGGFRKMPHYENLSGYQQSILQYVGTCLEYRPENLYCCVKNVQIEGIEDKVGRVSKPGMPLDDQEFESHVSELRVAIAKQHPERTLHYLCLPPLDLTRLSNSSKTMILDDSPSSKSTRTSVEMVNMLWLRGRSRDNVFIAWVHRNWPQGGPLDEVLERIEFADWLISLMSYTRYRPKFQDGKRMMVRIACLCAERAQEWCKDDRAADAIEAVHKWIESPTAEQQAATQALVDNIKAEGKKSGEIPPKDPSAYIREAVRESAVRAAIATYTNDPNIISSSAARAAASSVMAASFANADKGDGQKEDSWLRMIGAAAAPGEAAENRWLCNAIRELVRNTEKKEKRV